MIFSTSVHQQNQKKNTKIKCLANKPDFKFNNFINSLKFKRKSIFHRANKSKVALIERKFKQNYKKQGFKTLTVNCKTISLMIIMI